MPRTEAIRKLRRAHWRALQGLLEEAYAEGYQAGTRRARGQGRRGRTIRADATVEGLVRKIEDHFGLDRYAFEVRVVHRRSGKRVPAKSLVRTWKAEP